ncbi:DUF4238 domain-containing protein [Pseudomonas sp. G34]|uniref:DUF4238 domain-containing protein n=1 Tax=Pseudomonas sp. G34 TaxID=3059083 RepID=UPI002806C114|nr:DUF4238 domain-containing protein [Pseudomonas sp. G34]MDQ7987286.1 DUF4238 domain-containing protein [Pseudomonas sp. G34]
MNKKMFEVKRNHHHIWADYLRRWSSDGKNIYYTTNKKNIVLDSVRGVAKEKDFYKLTDLSSVDINLIRAMSQNSPLELQRHHMRHLSDFIKLDQTYCNYRATRQPNPKFEAAHHALKHNLLENLHSAHERRVLPILNRLAEGDLSVLGCLDQMIKFLMYFGHQFTRTKNFKDAVFSSLPRTNDLECRLADSMEHAWWFHSYMMGMNFGKSLFDTRFKDTHALLVNNSQLQFIASDQPIINIHRCLATTPRNTPPKHADFYYPISPVIAYVICDSDTFASGINFVDEHQVRQLNEKLARRANAHIFGQSRDSLAELVSIIGKDEP